MFNHKKVITIILTLILTFSFTICVRASEVDNVKSDNNTRIIKYEEIKDLDGLINMALEQRQQNPLLLEYNPNFPNNNSLNVTQLIEERIYEDGTFEQKFASTSIAFYSNKPNGTLKCFQLH